MKVFEHLLQIYVIKVGVLIKLISNAMLLLFYIMNEFILSNTHNKITRI